MNGSLRSPAVVRLLVSDLLATTSTLMIMTTLGWQAYARSGQPLTLGLLGLAEFVPVALLALTAGQLADRHDRRRVAAASMAAEALVGGLLALDAASGDRGVGLLYVLAALSGTAKAFSSPALTPLLAAAVPAANLARAMALGSIAWQSGVIFGPAAAGVLNAAGNPVPYVVASAFASLTAVVLLRLPHEIGVAHLGAVREEASLRNALEGVRLILRTPLLLGAISLDLVAVLVGGATALLPVFARDVLHSGATANGLLRAAPGVGAFAVGLYLARRPLRRRVGPALFGAVAAFGGLTILFGLSRNLVLSMAALAGLAAADMVSVVIRSTLAPLVTPPALRGRVGAVERVFVGGSNELGAFESGVAAALVGAIPAVIAGGVLAIVAAAVWARAFPSLRGIDGFEDVEPATMAAGEPA